MTVAGKLPPDTVVLVIEDDESTRALLTRLLRVAGAAQVVEATDGCDGLLKLHQIKPTLVICDLGMAPVWGASFLAAMRYCEDRLMASTPAIFFTSTDDPEAVKTLQSLGVDGVLKKPFNPKGLIEKVEKVAETRHLKVSGSKLGQFSEQKPE
ncbi:MAG: response regulator [Magnetospirillum sp.]|nr:response regulator [Magnetospirillum sp.]